MGCDQSREKSTVRPTLDATVFTVPTPLPLHLYHEYNRSFTVSPSSSTSSSTSSTPTSSPTHRAPPSPVSSASPTSFPIGGVSRSRMLQLKSIAYYKFPKFHKFSPHVQEQLLLHIDKELHSMR